MRPSKLCSTHNAAAWYRCPCGPVATRATDGPWGLMRNLYLRTALAALILLATAGTGAIAADFQSLYDYCESANRNTCNDGDAACTAKMDTYCRSYANAEVTRENQPASDDTHCGGSACTPRQWCRYVNRGTPNALTCPWNAAGDAPGCAALDKSCASLGY